MDSRDFQRLRTAIMEYSDRVLYKLALRGVETLKKEHKTEYLPPSSQIHGIHRRSLGTRDPNRIFSANPGKDQQVVAKEEDSTFEAFVLAKAAREERRMSQASYEKRDEHNRNKAYFLWVWQSTFKQEETAPKRVLAQLLRDLDLPQANHPLKSQALILLFEAWMNHVFSHSIPHAEPKYKGGRSNASSSRSQSSRHQRSHHTQDRHSHRR